MDLEKTIRISAGDKYVELPLKNFLRVFFVHVDQLLPEFYEDPNIDSNSINSFWKWLKVRLDVKEGEQILL